MKSIKGYLTTRLLAAAGLVLFAAGGAVYWSVSRALTSQFDADLAARARALASLLFQVHDEVELAYSEELMPEYTPGPAPDYFELRFDDGRMLEFSESLGDEEGPPEERMRLDVPWEARPEARHWSAPLPDGRAGRYVVQSLTVHHVFPEEGPERPAPTHVSVVVARGRRELDASLRAVLWQCAIGSAAVLGLIAGATLLAIRRGLEPAGRVAAAMASLRVHELPERLELGSLPDELEPIARTTNELIRRIDDALKRERRTTADIAHELRTPIAEMLTVSEVALRGPARPEEAQQALTVVRTVAWRMGRAVSTLLKLARLEMGDEPFEREEVDLHQTLGEAVRSLAHLEEQRGVRIESDCPGSFVVWADREALRIVVSNLLSNAMHDSPAGSGVRCSVSRSDDRWMLALSNPAPGLVAADLESLGEAFWRKERARGDRDRSGLGLALSTALAKLGGMRLEFALEDGTFIATLSGRDVVASARDDLRKEEPDPERSFEVRS